MEAVVLAIAPTVVVGVVFQVIVVGAVVGVVLVQAEVLAVEAALEEVVHSVVGGRSIPLRHQDQFHIEQPYTTQL